MFETILVPLDGSDLAETALATALEIKEKFNSRLIILRSVEPASHHMLQAPGVMESPAAAVANVELIQQITEAEEKEAREYLDGLPSHVSASGVETVMAEGDPADAIVDTASRYDVGLIVMSSHGRGGLGRLVFGSVADAVLRNSPVPVLLIRPLEDKDS